MSNTMRKAEDTSAMVGEHPQGVQGARSDPLASSCGGPERSDVSDAATACQGADAAVAIDTKAASTDAKHRRRGNPRLDTRYDPKTLAALRTRAKRLGLDPSAWVRSVVRDALDKRRTDEVDAAVGAALVGVETMAQPSADVRLVAAQIRPLAINVNDLDRRARLGESVTLGPEVSELIELLREVRAMLGDRVAT